MCVSPGRSVGIPYTQISFSTAVARSRTNNPQKSRGVKLDPVPGVCLCLLMGFSVISVGLYPGMGRAMSPGWSHTRASRGLARTSTT